MKSLSEHINESVEVQEVNEAFNAVDYSEIVQVNELLAKLSSSKIKPAAKPINYSKDFSHAIANELQNLSTTDAIKNKLIDTYLSETNFSKRDLQMLINLSKLLSENNIRISVIIGASDVLEKQSINDAVFDWTSRKIGFDVTFNSDVTEDEVRKAFEKTLGLIVIFYDSVKDVFIGWKK